MGKGANYLVLVREGLALLEYYARVLGLVGRAEVQDAGLFQGNTVESYFIPKLRSSASIRAFQRS